MNLHLPAVFIQAGSCFQVCFQLTQLLSCKVCGQYLLTVPCSPLPSSRLLAPGMSFHSFPACWLLKNGTCSVVSLRKHNSPRELHLTDPDVFLCKECNTNCVQSSKTPNTVCHNKGFLQASFSCVHRFIFLGASPVFRGRDAKPQAY